MISGIVSWARGWGHDGSFAEFEPSKGCSAAEAPVMLEWYFCSVFSGKLWGKQFPVEKDSTGLLISS